MIVFLYHDINVGHFRLLLLFLLQDRATVSADNYEIGWHF